MVRTSTYHNYIDHEVKEFTPISGLTARCGRKRWLGPREDCTLVQMRSNPHATDLRDYATAGTQAQRRGLCRFPSRLRKDLCG